MKQKACLDCESYHYETAYYMVHDHIWMESGGGKGKLCLYCLTKRLGRKLNRSDFNDAPCNKPIISVLDCVNPDSYNG